MATKIADGNSNASLQGSPDKHIDIAPDGTMWMMYMYQGGTDGTIKFFYSRDGGSTWTHAFAGDLSVGQTYATPSFFIDSDGYAHMCWSLWNKDPQSIRYARGVPRYVTSGDKILFRGWTWTTATISPASGRVQIDTDVIAFRNGSGWTAFVAYTLDSSGGCQVARVDITRIGGISVASTTIGPSSGLGLLQMGSIDFVHTGDGKTPSSAPDLYLATGLKTTSGSIRVNRAVYSAGTWTWATPVVAGTATLDESCLCSVHDGVRFMTAWAGSSGGISVAEWTGSGATTARNPPALPGGVGKVLGLSLSCDPVTTDLYLAFYDVTDGDIRWSRFTRATATWSAWAVAVTRTATNYDGKVNLVRHPPRDAVDMLYGVGSASSWQIYHQQLAALIRIPAAPTLLLPASGQAQDLAAGATFTWDYNPVTPGDTQQAWAFTRTIPGPTVQWWNNASQSWGSTIVWNAGAQEYASFPAGVWTTSTTYSWSVRVRSAAGQDSPAAASRTVVATSAPVLDVTGPTGIAYGDSTPLVTWDYTALSAQRDYQVRIIAEQVGIDPDSTTPVWDSGVVSSAIGRSARIGTPLTDGGTYRAYVRTTSAATISSGWDFESFTISVTPANGPNVAASVVSWPATGVPRVRLDLTGQSSLLTEAQNDGSDGWENDSNATVVQQAADTVNQISQGIKMTSVAAGAMRARTEVGDPPTATVGEPAPTSPLSFPVVAGKAYTAIASLKAAATSRSARVLIRWYDADDGTGALLSTSTGSSVTISSVAYGQVSVTATAPVGAVLARMVIEVLATAAASEVFYVTAPALAPGTSVVWQPGGYSAAQTLRVERSDDGGLTWTQIEDRVKTSLAQQATVYDRSMPMGIVVQYRAYTDVDQGGGALSTSGASPAVSITITADRWGLRDLNDDVGEMYAYVVAHQRSDDESSSVHRPAGREGPIVDTEGLHLATGVLSVFVKQADIPAAITVLRRTAVMIVQSPSGGVFLARFIDRDYNIEALRHRVIDVRYVEVEAV